MLFAIKSSFKFPALATPNEVDRVMMVTNDVTSGISRSFMLFFRLLDDRIARPTSICLFALSRKTPFHYWNNSYLN